MSDTSEFYRKIGTISKGEFSYSVECDFLCDVVTGPNCDGGREIRKVEDPCLSIGAQLFISLGDFKNSNGETIADVLRDVEYNFTMQLIEEDEKKWADYYNKVERSRS